ncbi:hypothetical protein HOL34_03890 [bacterium]|jgi:hypothetical protein|nr:hypothetical protein [bacterium]
MLRISSKNLLTIHIFLTGLFIVGNGTLQAVDRRNEHRGSVSRLKNAKHYKQQNLRNLNKTTRQRQQRFQSSNNNKKSECVLSNTLVSLQLKFINFNKISVLQRAISTLATNYFESYNSCGNDKQ